MMENPRSFSKVISSDYRVTRAKGNYSSSLLAGLGFRALVLGLA